MKKLTALLLLTLCLGCSDWERTSFNSLAASKAVIDQTQNDYEARTIPHSKCVYDIITRAKSAQTVAVDALLGYEQTKSDAAKTAVQTDLAQLTPLIASVKNLADPNVCGGSK